METEVQSYREIQEKQAEWDRVAFGDTLCFKYSFLMGGLPDLKSKKARKSLVWWKRDKGKTNIGWDIIQSQSR